MRKFLAALAFLAALIPAVVSGQQFPLTMGPSTVYGRLGLGTGPGQAIPFATLKSRLFGDLSPPVVVTDPGYGAICSGSVADAATNATAFATALATGRNVLVPYCPLGYNFGTNSIAVASGQSVTCENQATVLYGQGAKLFYISSVGPETKVENCTVQMAGGVSGATAFLFKTASAVVNVVTLRNIKCLYVYHCVDDEGTNPVSFLNIDGAYTTQTYGLQFRLRNSNGFVNLRNLNCDFTNEVSIGLVTWGCAEFDNFIGLRVSGLTVATGVGAGVPVFVASNPAFKFSTGQALWIDGALFADHTAGDGVLIDGVQYLWGDRIEGSINLGTQVTISNSTDGNVANLICFGGSGQVGAAASKTGCDINNVNITNFANIYEKNATGTGVTIRGTSQSLNVANLIATVNTGGGLAVQNSATNINITNAFVGGNTGTGYANTSSGAVFIGFASGGTQWAQQTAPPSPASGNVALWFDTTDARFHDKNASGTIGTTVQPATCTNQFATAIAATGGVTCTTDTLASAQHANQGTTTTVLHGNAAGNPAWSAIVLTTDVTGTLPALNGGTGQASFAVGDLLYASTTTALSRLADVATGSVLVSGGVNTAPAWSNAITVTSSVTTATLVGTSSTITPIVVGSSANTTGTLLTLKTTTAAGTTDAITFAGGNNGATTFATLNATGLGVGVAPAVRLHAKGAGELARLETTAAVGAGGVAYMRYDDSGGQQGYFGFAGVNNRFDIMPNTGNTLALGAGAAVAATFDTSQQMFLPVAPATDATKTDNTLCRDTTTGQVYRGSGAAGICLGTSGRQFKNSIVDIADGLDEIAGLRPRNFFYNPGYGDDGHRLQYGFVADEVLGALPKVVGLDSNGKPNTVDMLAMTPIMVRAIQQLASRVGALEQKGH